MAKENENLPGLDDLAVELQALMLTPTGLGGPDAALRACQTSKEHHDIIKLNHPYWRAQIHELLHNHGISVSAAQLAEWLPPSDFSTIYFRLRDLLGRGRCHIEDPLGGFRETLLGFDGKQWARFFQVVLYSPTVFKSARYQQANSDAIARYKQYINTDADLSPLHRLQLWQSALSAGNLLLVETLSLLDSTLTLSPDYFICAMTSGNAELVRWLLDSPRFKQNFYSYLCACEDVYAAIAWIRDRDLRAQLADLSKVAVKDNPSWKVAYLIEAVRCGGRADVECIIEEFIAEKSLAQHELSQLIDVCLFYAFAENQWHIIVPLLTRLDDKLLSTHWLQHISLLTFPRRDAPPRFRHSSALDRVFHEDGYRESNQSVSIKFKKIGFLNWLLLAKQKGQRIFTQDDLIKVLVQRNSGRSLFKHAFYEGNRQVVEFIWGLATPEQRQILVNICLEVDAPWKAACYGWVDMTQAFWAHSDGERQQKIVNQLSDELLCNLVTKGNVAIFDFAWSKAPPVVDTALKKRLCKLYQVAFQQDHSELIKRLEAIAETAGVKLVDDSVAFFKDLVTGGHLAAVVEFWATLTRDEKNQVLVPGDQGAFYSAGVKGHAALLTQLYEWMSDQQRTTIAADTASLEQIQIQAADIHSLSTLLCLQSLGLSTKLRVEQWVWGTRFDFSYPRWAGSMRFDFSYPMLAWLVANTSDEAKLISALLEHFNGVCRSIWDGEYTLQLLWKLNHPGLTQQITANIPALMDCSADCLTTPVAEKFQLYLQDSAIFRAKFIAAEVTLSGLSAVNVLFSLPTSLFILKASLYNPKKLREACREDDALNAIYYQSVAVAILTADIPKLILLTQIDNALFTETWTELKLRFGECSHLGTHLAFAAIIQLVDIQLYLIKKSTQFRQDIQYTERFNDFAKLLADLQAFINQGKEYFLRNVSVRISQVEPLTTGAITFLGKTIKASDERYRRHRDELSKVLPMMLFQGVQQYLQFLYAVNADPMGYNAETVAFVTKLIDQIVALTPQLVATPEMPILEAPPPSISEADEAQAVTTRAALGEVQEGDRSGDLSRALRRPSSIIPRPR